MKRETILIIGRFPFLVLFKLPTLIEYCPMNEYAPIIKQYFDPYFEAPIEVWESFAQHLTLSSFSKNEVIKKSNTTENNLQIIIEGAAGIFLWKEQTPVCLDLCFEGEFFGDYMSFVTQQPSTIFTQAIEKTSLLCISHHKLNNLYKNSLEGLNIGRIASESLFVHKQNQQIELLTMTAEDRYRSLIKRNREIALRAPQKYIASYLGITPESFSRIRRNITNS